MEKYDSYNMENTEQKEFELKETDQQNDQIREMGQVTLDKNPEKRRV